MAAEAPLGVLMLDHRLTRPPGDPGNPRSFPFPVLIRELPGISLERLLARDPALLGPLVKAGRGLAARGAWGITSGCGFFVIFQREMARAMPVPVFLSSLLQLPLAQAAVGPEASVGILTAHAGRLTEAHLEAAGRLPWGRVTVVGLEDRPHFAEGVLKSQGRYDVEGIRREVVSAARELMGRDPALGALVLECTNLPPFARDVQVATGLPVYDITTLVHLAKAACVRGPFEALSPGPSPGAAP
jgi:hypothetical protein